MMMIVNVNVCDHLDVPIFHLTLTFVEPLPSAEGVVGGVGISVLVIANTPAAASDRGRDLVA